MFASGELDALVQQVDVCRESLRALSLERRAELKNLAVFRQYQAYFCLCADLLKREKNSASVFPLVASPATVQEERKLYIMGDSHTFALAWRKLKRSEHVIVPLPIVGLKAYHFHPRFRNTSFMRAFRHHLSVLQREGHKKCVISAGEIDCRMDEGILLALEKKVYTNLEVAVQETVAVYLQGLEEMKKEANFEGALLIHPPPPSSKQNQPLRSEMLWLFDQCLERSLRNRRDIMLLPMGAALRTYSINKKSAQIPFGILKGQYCCDGTHLNGNYLPLFENALATTVGA